MSIEFGILIFAIALVIFFDLVNGFHDAANSIATVVSTQVLHPSSAVLWVAFFNFIAMFFFPPKVADTISKIIKIGFSDYLYLYVVLCGVLSALFWALFTWWLGLPISSSHALVGGIAGAGVAHAGWQALEWNLFLITVAFIVIAPLIGFILGSFYYAWYLLDFQAMQTWCH